MGARTLRGCRTVDCINGFGYVVNEPKAAGRRMIMLPVFAVEMLKRQRVEQLEARLQAGSSWEDMNLMIVDLNGGFFITADIYAHMLPSQQKEAANKWDQEFRSNVPGSLSDGYTGRYTIGQFVHLDRKTSACYTGLE